MPLDQSSPIDIDDLVALARNGDQSAHKRLIKEFHQGNISISHGNASVDIGGDVSNSIVVAGNNNKIITLEPGSYEDFDELVSAISEQSARREMAVHLASSVLRGRKSVFGDVRLAGIFKEALDIVSQRALDGDESALELVRELDIHGDAVSAKLGDLIDYLLKLFEENPKDVRIIEICADISWAMGTGTKMRTVVKRGLDVYPENHNLLVCQAAILEHNGEFRGALEILYVILTDMDQINIQTCETQAIVRSYIAYLIKDNGKLANGDEKTKNQTTIDKCLREAEEI